MADYSASIAYQVNRFLTEDDWKYEFDDENGRFRFNLNIGTKLGSVQYTIQINNGGFTVYCTAPIHADSEDRKQMGAIARFLHGANYGLRYGNFEFDFRDGEIRYKVAQLCGKSDPDTNIVKRCILVPAAMFERYSPGFLGIIFADQDPEDALRKCEEDM